MLCSPALDDIVYLIQLLIFPLLPDHHRNLNGNSANADDVGEDLVVIRQNPQQQQHVNNQTPTSSAANVVVTSGSYDASSVTKTTSNSAFTPINVMPPHLNTLAAAHHHQQLAAAQRPSYLYDAISFQNQKTIQQAVAGNVGGGGGGGGGGNTFPNQLISLHQIRNYAHQPTSGLIAGEHLLMGGVGKTEKQ